MTTVTASVVIPSGELAHSDPTSLVLSMLMAQHGYTMTDLRKTDRLNAQGLEGAILLKLPEPQAASLVELVAKRSGPYRATIRKS